jgi:hypothetical protein
LKREIARDAAASPKLIASEFRADGIKPDGTARFLRILSKLGYFRGQRKVPAKIDAARHVSWNGRPSRDLHFPLLDEKERPPRRADTAGST